MQESFEGDEQSQKLVLLEAYALVGEAIGNYATAGNGRVRDVVVYPMSVNILVLIEKHELLEGLPAEYSTVITGVHNSSNVL